ncbi:MAG: CvpA family protein [Lachnospiraceae bacterium]|nr:CvpA family protein [Lachnospiraceae bacterium]
MNILEIIILIITCLMAFSGFRQGFVKKLASMLSLALSIILVSAILPYMTSFIKENTPLYDYIVEQCEQVAAEQILGQWTTSSDTEEGTASLADMTREEAKALMEEYGYGAYTSVVDSLSDEEFEQYKEQYLQQYISELFSSDDTDSGESSITLDESTQNEIIESLPIPEVIKTMLINHNNEEGYASLDVSSFQDYIIEYLATMILNVISFLIVLILVQIILRVLIAVLNVIAHFPVIGLVNRVAGTALGLLEALFLLWIFFLLVTVLQATSFGASLFAMIDESPVLTWLYESNLFLRIVMWVAAIFA